MGAIWEKNDLRRSSKRGHKTLGGDAGHQGIHEETQQKNTFFFWGGGGGVFFFFAGDFVEVNFPTQKTVGRLGKKLGKRSSWRHDFQSLRSEGFKVVSIFFVAGVAWERLGCNLCQRSTRQDNPSVPTTYSGVIWNIQICTLSRVLEHYSLWMEVCSSYKWPKINR